MVLQAKVTEFSNKPVLHVWLAYNHGDGDVIDAGMRVLQETASRMNAHKITFGSPRKGWAKRFPVVTTHYEIPKGA